MADEPTSWSETPPEPRAASASFISKIRWGLVAFIAISVVVIVLAYQEHPGCPRQSVLVGNATPLSSSSSWRQC